MEILLDLKLHTSIEYKLFTFYSKGVNIDSNDTKTKNVEELTCSGEWVFNNSVVENLEFCLDYYLRNQNISPTALIALPYMLLQHNNSKLDE